MAENKSLSALLNGISRHDYFGDSEMSDQFLKEQLFAEMSSGEYEQLANKSRRIIKSLAMTDMDLNQAETFLTSQARKRDGGITEDQSKVFLKFWKNQKTKIHDTLVQQCLWDNTVKNLSWRIDVKAQTRNLEQINTPTAIVEMQLGNRLTPDMTEVVRFEMDSEGLSSVLSSLKDVEEQIEKHVKQ